MSNTPTFVCVGLAIDIIHKNRGYCSFFVQSPINQGLFVFYTRYALHYAIAFRESFMTKIEKNIITWLEEHVHICFFIAVLILGCVMRIAGFHFIGSDMELCLLDWYKDIMQKGISEQVGNYNIPYQVIILILTKLPLKPHHAYKLVSCAFDLAMAFAGGWIVWKICEDNKKTEALFAFSIVFLSPLVVINSAV